MKVRFAVAMAATLFAGALTMAADGSWTGWISDSQCGVKGANDKAGTIPPGRRNQRDSYEDSKDRERQRERKHQ